MDNLESLVNVLKNKGYSIIDEQGFLAVKGDDRKSYWDDWTTLPYLYLSNYDIRDVAVEIEQILRRHKIENILIKIDG